MIMNKFINSQKEKYSYFRLLLVMRINFCSINSFGSAHCHITLNPFIIYEEKPVSTKMEPIARVHNKIYLMCTD